MPSTRSSASPRKLPHSSDTELFETPVRKRFRVDDDESVSQSPPSPRKRQRRDTTKGKGKVTDLEAVLRSCANEPVNHAAILRLKDTPIDEYDIRQLIKTMIHSAKRSVMEQRQNSTTLLLETELYVLWLEELNYAVVALDNAMGAKVPGTRKRVPGLGRACYQIVYNLVDEFIDEVNVHHDGWSFSEPSLYPTTMSLVDEAKDDSTDHRSDEAVKQADAAFKEIDRVMVDAVRRFKAERGRNNPSLASKISSQEYSLAKSCCLLCEQTGYGAEEDDMGFTLMEDTRAVMTQWKNEYEDCEDQLVDSD